MLNPINSNHCPTCGEPAGNECVSPSFKPTKTHKSRAKYAEAMQIDRDHGLTAAKKFLSSYPN